MMPTRNARFILMLAVVASGPQRLVSASDTATVALNGTRLHYEVAGLGMPVVLIHAYEMDSRMWDDQFEMLSGRYRVIRYDLRGFGRSAPPDTVPYSHADDLLALLDHLHIRNAVVVGAGVGGRVAIDFALAHPSRVRALVPCCAHLQGYVFRSYDMDTVFELGRAQGIPVARAYFLADTMFAVTREHPEAFARLQTMVNDYSGWIFTHSDAWIRPKKASIHRLGEIRAPTLVIIGERDLQDFRTCALTLYTQVPDAREKIIPRAGHLPNMEEPEHFNEALLEFLSQLKGR